MDYRKRLYDTYVSSFKGEDSSRAQTASSSYFQWADHKLIPLLKGLGSEARILDLGCGNGAFLKLLKQKGYPRVCGVDISEEQVRIAVDTGCDAVVADVFDYLAERKDQFDAVVGLDFIEHFQKDELMTLVPLMHDALKPGGRLILQTPNGQGLFPHSIIYGDMTHSTIFTPGSLKHLLQQAGFGEFAFEETGPVPKNLKGRVRQWLWRLIRFHANLIRQIETGKKQDIWTENMICCCRRGQ